MSSKVFLDMDGVLVDFVGGLHTALGVDYDPKNYPYEASKYDMFEDLCAKTNGRVSMDNLYRACDSREFWANLKWDPMGKEILDSIAKVYDMDYDKKICICTSPMANPDAWAGKVEWLNKNLGWCKHIAIMTAPKHLLAKPGAVLIDDKDSNVEQFQKHGGAAFLVPQPWNTARGLVGTDYTSDIKTLLKLERKKDEFNTNPCKFILEGLGF